MCRPCPPRPLCSPSSVRSAASAKPRSGDHPPGPEVPPAQVGSTQSTGPSQQGLAGPTLWTQLTPAESRRAPCGYFPRRGAESASPPSPQRRTEQESSRYDEELTQGHGRGEVETVLRAGPLIVYELQLQTSGNDGNSVFRFPEAKRDFDTSCRLQSGAYALTRVE